MRVGAAGDGRQGRAGDHGRSHEAGSDMGRFQNLVLQAARRPSSGAQVESVKSSRVNNPPGMGRSYDRGGDSVNADYAWVM